MSRANSPIRVVEQPYTTDFETSLRNEVSYLKKMEQNFEAITKQQTMHNTELDKAKLLHMSTIPAITGHTNYGTVMKNKKPSIQMSNFVLT